MKNDNELIADLNMMLNICQLARSNEDSSFAGEYLILEKYTKDLQISKGCVVDMAASNGYSQSCTLNFFKQENWRGLAVEMDSTKFSQLSFLYANFPNARLARNRITPNNVVQTLMAFEIPYDFDLLNLDIDSYDLFVINSILKSEYKPKIISMEINEKIPSGIFFTVNFDEEYFAPEDHFFGCSLDAACTIVKPYGYKLVALEYNNAIFIHHDFSNNPFLGTNYEDLSAENAYSDGYKNRGDRTILFPWNKNIDHWLNLNPEQAIKEISNYFQKHDGYYTIRKI